MLFKGKKERKTIAITSVYYICKRKKDKNYSKIDLKKHQCCLWERKKDRKTLYNN